MIVGVDVMEAKKDTIVEEVVVEETMTEVREIVEAERVAVVEEVINTSQSKKQNLVIK